jgi:hypothetical protein
MSDENEVTEMYRELRNLSSGKRSHNRRASRQLLQKHQVSFTTHNDGVHLIVKHNNRELDFWPGTGKWVSRKDRTVKGRGVHTLLQYCGVRVDRDPHENSVGAQ